MNNELPVKKTTIYLKFESLIFTFYYNLNEISIGDLNKLHVSYNGLIVEFGFYYSRNSIFGEMIANKSLFVLKGYT